MADTDVAGAMTRSFLGSLPPEVVAELIAEGSAPRAVLVVHGLIRVYMTSPEGRQVTVRYARDSDVLGIALIVGGPISVGAQTLAQSSLFSVDARRLTKAARHDARVAWPWQKS
ncbi:MAG: cyclic nucleotide-binding domain-containing protein [Pseudonocardiaceae bacterium]